MIDAVGGQAVVFAESSGAVLALEAVRRGVPVTRLVCYEPPFIVDDSRAPMAADFRARFDALVGAGKRAEAFAMFMTEAAGLPAEMTAGLTTDPLWPQLDSVTHTISYDNEVTGGSQTGLAKYAGVAIPVLVLDGGESPRYQRNAAKALAGVLPDAERRTLPDEHHQFTAAGLAPVIREFFGRADS